MNIALLALLMLTRCAAGSTLIDHLAAEQLPVSYVNDDAGDATVMSLGSNSDGDVTAPPPAIRDLVLAGEESIPLLIRCLQDSRKTTATYRSTGVEAAPLGFVCLDALIHLVEGPVHIEDCADDGMGACVRSGYYFMPDASISERARVQAQWQKLWDQERLEFRAPAWGRPVG